MFEEDELLAMHNDEENSKNSIDTSEPTQQFSVDDQRINSANDQSIPVDSTETITRKRKCETKMSHKEKLLKMQQEFYEKEAAATERRTLVYEKVAETHSRMMQQMLNEKK